MAQKEHGAFFPASACSSDPGSTCDRIGNSMPHAATTCKPLPELPDDKLLESVERRTVESRVTEPRSCDTLDTYESLPDLDIDRRPGNGSEVATCDTLPELEPPTKCAIGRETAFEAVEEGSEENDSSCALSLQEPSESDSGSGPRGSFVCEASWGRVAANAFGFEVDQVLKLGQFGGVRMMRSRRKGTLVVAKCTVNTDSSDHRPSGRREYELLQSLRHDSIINSLCILETKFETYMFLEWCANGSLWTYVSSSREGLQLKEKRSLGLQLIGAIDHVHRACILHCAVQPANILITSGGWLRLSGFGSSRRTGQNSNILRPELTQEELARAVTHDVLLAPELAGPSWATSRADVWGFCLCVVFMYFGKLAPDGVPGGPEAACSRACRRWDTTSAWQHWDAQLEAKEPDARSFYSVIAMGLNQNPLMRPCIAEIEC